MSDLPGCIGGKMGIILNNISFGFTESLINGLNCRFDDGWTAVVGANGAGKTSLLRLITGELKPGSGSIECTDTPVFCSQQTSAIPENAEALFTDCEPESYRLQHRFGLSPEWIERWETLSFGEKKRLQIASGLYTGSEILILDEPSNHLDQPSRDLLITALKSFRGTGIIVSHDRLFLNELAYQTLFLEPPAHDLRRQGYDAVSEARKTEQNYIRNRQKQIGSEVRRLEKRAAEYRQLAGTADRRRSKRNIAAADHDAKSKIDAARLTGKDAVDGRTLNRLQGRIEHQKGLLEQYNPSREKSFNYSLRFKPGRYRTLFTVPDGMLELGDKQLSFGSFQMQSEDKVALSGVNGSGKSSLLNHIYGRCRKDGVFYLKQEISSMEAEAFFSRAGSLDSAERGRIYAIMAALGSPPERVLQAENPSPGEMRKLLIAEAITNEIEFLILDEPTNHLDLPSIEALELALAEYGAGLLLVSHDRLFLENTTDIRWQITPIEENRFELKL